MGSKVKSWGLAGDTSLLDHQVLWVTSRGGVPWPSLHDFLIVEPGSFDSHK